MAVRDMAAIHAATGDPAVREIAERYRPGARPAPPRDEIISWREAGDGDQVLAGGHLVTIEHAGMTAEGTIVVTTARHGTLTFPADDLTARRITYKPAVPALSPVDPDLLTQAAAYVVTRKTATAGAIQKKVRVGYAQAAALLDHLEALGVVGPADGDKPRKVLVSPDMLAEVTSRIERQAETLTGCSQGKPRTRHGILGRG